MDDDEFESAAEFEPEYGDESGSGRGGYLFTADPDAPRLTLAEALVPRSVQFALSVPPERIANGQYYLLGTPGSPNCEVVQVDEGPARPGRPRSIRRALFGTVVTAHPAGTTVTPISVERIADWNQWRG